MKPLDSKNKLRWRDHYSQRAQKERYPARSVFKLKEAQRKFRLIKKGDRVLDLGCSPGSWLLYAAEVVGQRGRVVGIDLQAIRINMPPQVQTLTADILAIDRAWIDKELPGNRFDVVLSDMAPSTSGNKALDAARSFELCQAALHLADMVLQPGGSFMCKIFQGEEFREFSDAVRSRFKRHKIFKPQSSRKESKEIFVMGTGFRDNRKILQI
jgi:23S rRNA (uridine2552-2'-O)-methyltransferase